MFSSTMLESSHRISDSDNTEGTTAASSVRSHSRESSMRNREHKVIDTHESLPTVMTDLKSITGILSLLQEQEPEIKIFALSKLNEIVDRFWPEMSESIPMLEALFEQDLFNSKELVALLISKIYFYLREYDEALSFSLLAGSEFHLDDNSEYCETIRHQCIETYINQRQSRHDKNSMSMSIDTTRNKGIQDMMERIIQSCISVPSRIRQVIGIALDTERIDIIKTILDSFNSSSERESILEYIRKVCIEDVNQSKIQFRSQVLTLLVNAYQNLSNPDYHSMCECWINLEDYESLAQFFDSNTHTHDLYQLSFFVYENTKPKFLEQLVTHINTIASSREKSSDSIKNILKILTGEISTRLYLEFLCKNNHTDKNILQTTKSHLNVKSSAHHSALTLSHAILQYGTTNDEFLRQNMEFLSYANNWSKFIATAGLGLIHKGHVEGSMHLLSPYLPPQDGSNSSSSGGIHASPYSEGGALFALGLIHAGHHQSHKNITDYLLNQLIHTQQEVIQHGACFGLGIAAMGTQDKSIYEAIKSTLFTDSAIAGESAGISIGLVMLGSRNPNALDELLHYAHDTQHEKIIRGVSMGIALMMYGSEDQADIVIDQLCMNKDPILQYGGMYCIGLAYAGTGNHRMLKRLLHAAVSDANDDVRRASVISIGLLMHKQPRQVPKLVQLLSESHHPHVRYGAALALGISCAGTGQFDAIQLLEPLTVDMVDFVRQGALVALAMILIQHTDGTSNGKAGHVRLVYEKIISDKYEGVPTKIGAVLGQGLMNAGGGNITISPNAPNGIVGLALWSEFWYWYPMIPFICLAFQPTSIICLDENFKLPNFELLSNAKPSMFAYSEKSKSNMTQTQDKSLSMAVLSTAAKARVRSKKLEEKRRKSSNNNIGNMMVSMKVDKKSTSDTNIEPSQTESDKQVQSTVIADIPEPDNENISNFSRITPAQRSFLEFLPDSRYVPVHWPDRGFKGGIQIIRDTRPDEAKIFIDSFTVSEKEKEIIQPPKPFEYREE